jgi:hypothetical protein
MPPVWITSIGCADLKGSSVLSAAILGVGGWVMSGS